MNNIKKPLILVVDDVPKNLQVFGSLLFDEGYEVVLSDSAESAQNILKNLSPDLILLDIMMPVMDGFELCKIIKNDDKIKQIPIIFLTAKFEIENIVEGFKLGAVDYITKPFNSEELLSRVRTHIELQQTRRKIIETNKELEELIKQKEEFFGIVVHDLKNPLNSIMGYINIFLTSIEKNNFNNEFKLPVPFEFLYKVRETSILMLNTINQLLNSESIDGAKLVLDKKDIDVSKIIKSVILSFKHTVNTKSLSIYINNFEGFSLNVDENRFREICENLISNAIKFSPNGKNIFIGLGVSNELDNKYVRLSIIDEGPGLSEIDLARVFGRFTKLSAIPTGGESSSGLGLSIVKKLTELHGGRVGVKSLKGEGAEFFIELPLTTDFNNSLEKIDEYVFVKVDLVQLDIQDSTKYNNLILEIESCIDLAKEEIVNYRTEILLKGEFWQNWEIISKTNIINDIIKFASDLLVLANKENITVLDKYANQMIEVTNNFDLVNLPKLLKFYPVLINSLTFEH